VDEKDGGAEGGDAGANEAFLREVFQLSSQFFLLAIRQAVGGSKRRFVSWGQLDFMVNLPFRRKTFQEFFWKDVLEFFDQFLDFNRRGRSRGFSIAEEEGEYFFICINSFGQLLSRDFFNLRRSRFQIM